MKKLALAFAAAGLLAAPAFACPNMEEKASEKPAETAPITAQKDKKAEQPKQPKATEKKDDKKPATDTAKAKSDKKPDKVSQR